jgi:hypothetical protein
MKTLANDRITIALDERFPRTLYFESGKTRILGEPEAMLPRLYLYRKSDRATITSDDPIVEATYTLACQGTKATYHAALACAGAKAVEFDLDLTLTGDDATIRLANVKEQGDWRLLTVRLGRIVSAGSQDGDSTIATCSWQGRLLDPAKCKPLLIDYSWVGFTARLCGAAVRPNLVVTIDIPGYEDLMIQEVRQYTRIASPQTIASLGAELMYRQRTVEDPNTDVGIVPPEDKCPRYLPLDEPLLCTQQKEVRLHFIRSQGKPLDWTDAARYFQSLIAPDKKCNPYYDNALVYKTLQANIRKPRMSVEQASDFIRRVHNLTDGMRQVCYMTGFQYIGHDSGWPDVSVVYDAVGTKKGIRQAIVDARQYNAELSFHLNYDVFSDTSPLFEGKYVTRTSTGKIGGQGVWDGNQLYGLCIPAYRKQLTALLDKVIAEYGIRDTVHLDTYSCGPYVYDASPLHPTPAYDLTQAKLDFIKEFNKRGLDMTSEGLTDPYVGHIGHVWALFDYGQTWEGEEKIPFACFIYHGAISWNGGHGFIPLAHFADKPGIEDAVLGTLVSGGGAGIEIPDHDRNPLDVADMLYLMQPPYNMLRNRKWTGYSRKDNIIRVDYAGEDSFIELDTAKPGYRVVVDGVTVAEDFTTVFQGPREGTLLAYSNTDRDLDWPAPKGWADGPVPAVTLTQNGPGIRPTAKIENGRIRVALKAHQPVRLGRP